ncbi:tetratricopeptide repeat protein [Calothrix sp. UHCC 0171]|uniref:tetratricopeptide repeat protein n=1 Tax=Calothrix sp. UHCC 0171 TaxID=3110245 RepID=UPI002B1EAAF5|nr:tetratricopeptide repeat protein [Calothrix sp. UHCC 0171]MEA5572854.1 tetratricopeptide repeat protein [Calothrix sp. UHCC 0171]
MSQENSGNAQGFQTQVNDGGTAYVGTNHININHVPKKTATAVNSIPYLGVSHFVGRRNELTIIHEKLHKENNTVAISAVSGMGGIGKTELAVKYAREHINDYPGGICWLNSRDTNLAAGIIQFVQLQMGLEVPQQDFQGNPLTLIQQVAWCWQHWQPAEGLVLVVLNDVTNLDGFAELLPTNNRFRVLMTTRLRNLDTNIQEIPLDVLSAEEALELLINLVGEKKINKELATAKELCKWLGYLPLGIELVGRYLVKKTPHFTLAKMLEQLKQQRLHQEAINPQQKGLSTAQRGVLAAFELSWVELNPETQKIAGLLSLFAADIFVWKWVESMTKSLNWDESDVETAIELLYQRHFVQCLEEDLYGYKIHPLIREFLKDKLTADGESKEIKQAFTNTFMEIAQTIPHTPTLEFINSLKTAISHLTEVVENFIDTVSDKNLIWAFTGLAWFYEGQGLYALAEPWYQQCVSAVRLRLGGNHPDVASSLMNLAGLYTSQGRYEAAEPLYIRALELFKQLLGENHLHVAISLNNLARLYDSQGRYETAEPLYIRALELYKHLLGDNHPDVATSLNNLAALYTSQGSYEAAEPLYQQALELRKQLLGENHPHVATSLNNLAALYKSQGRYEAAKPLYQQALELRKQLLGENHPHVAMSLNNLAGLYYSQGSYENAESLYIQALELRKQLLGENHPHVASSFNNLAALYKSQERYEAAEPLYIQALELHKQLLGENHPHVAMSLNNLAGLYESQGRYETAEPLYIQALELHKQLLGENHPHVATSLNNLAGLYESQGSYEAAEPLYIQALKICEQSLGIAHPNTMTVRGNYAAFLKELCKKKRDLGVFNSDERNWDRFTLE